MKRRKRIFQAFTSALLAVLTLGSCNTALPEQTETLEAASDSASGTAADTTSESDQTEDKTHTALWDFTLPTAEKEPDVSGTNLIPSDASTFTDIELSKTGWTTPFGGSLQSADGAEGKCLKFSGIQSSYCSPALNVRRYITEPGDYSISLSVMLKFSSQPKGDVFRCLLRGSGGNSFIKRDPSGNYYAALGSQPGATAGVWFTFSVGLTVLEGDLSDGEWQLCFDLINDAVSEIYIDNVTISKRGADRYAAADFFPETAETWVADELVINSSKAIENAPYTTELDLILTCGGLKLTIPGFWDGGTVWRVRFSLPKAGVWEYKTVCKTDDSLNARTGKLTCSEYSGALDIYKHGFVAARGERYFVYADGTPFFYLGDTHWNLNAEEYYSDGGAQSTVSHFKYIVNKRVSQGFTVYQSEPIGASFDLTDGLSEADIDGFKEYDLKFSYIASMGLVHANAQFFFTSAMLEFMRREDCAEQLRVLSRYWVARYSAYPVMWTLAQEIDDDFYYNENTGENTVLTKENNPYKQVCELLYEYDPYKHPITAHQEASFYTSASDSAFRDVTGHSWFGAQWAPAFNQRFTFDTAKDYWENSQGKPVVDYEGRYDHLWTLCDGARAQGWAAYLCGMYGCGYGAADIWLYNGSYDLDTETVADGVTVTPQDKSIKWYDSVELESAYQLGYMRAFFERLEWYKLVPRFEGGDYFKFENGKSCYVVASDMNETYVCYFYSKTNTFTGTLRGMADGAYTLQWFNPRTNEYSDPIQITPTDGEYVIGAKPDKGDWVLLAARS